MITYATIYGYPDATITYRKLGEEKERVVKQSDLDNAGVDLTALFNLLESQKSEEEIREEQMLELVNERLTDEEKIANKSVYPTWQSIWNNTVNANTYFRYEDVLYRVIKDNTVIYPFYLPSETPSEYEDMTKKLPQEDGSYPIWKQPLGGHDAYPIGSKVQHKGNNWECIQGNSDGLNSWEPGVFGWKDLGLIEGGE